MRNRRYGRTGVCAGDPRSDLALLQPASSLESYRWSKRTDAGPGMCIADAAKEKESNKPYIDEKRRRTAERFRPGSPMTLRLLLAFGERRKMSTARGRKPSEKPKTKGKEQVGVPIIATFGRILCSLGGFSTNTGGPSAMLRSLITPTRTFIFSYSHVIVLTGYVTSPEFYNLIGAFTFLRAAILLAQEIAPDPLPFACGGWGLGTRLDVHPPERSGV